MKNFRRRRIVQFPIQLKYAVILSVISAFISLVTIFVMAWFMQRNYNLFLGSEFGVSAQVIELVRREQSLLETTLFILFCFSVSSIFGASLFITRKLTGPVAALRRSLLLYSQGDWSRTFHLRKNDEFRDLEDIVNRIRESHVR